MTSIAPSNSSKLRAMGMHWRRSELDVHGSGRKLTWISREDHDSSSFAASKFHDGNDFAQPNQEQTQKGLVRPGNQPNADSPMSTVRKKTNTVIELVPESPARRAESVRQIRAPSDERSTESQTSNAWSDVSTNHVHSMVDVSQCQPTGTIQEGNESVKSDENTGLQQIGQNHTPQPSAVAADVDREQSVDSAAEHFLSSSNVAEESSQSLRMVVSYLAEETQRIIKVRKALNNRADPTAARANKKPVNPPIANSDAVLLNVQGGEESQNLLSSRSRFPLSTQSSAIASGEGALPTESSSPMTNSRQMETNTDFVGVQRSTSQLTGASVSSVGLPSDECLRNPNEIDNLFPPSRLASDDHGTHAGHVAMSPLNEIVGGTRHVPSPNCKENRGSRGPVETPERRRGNRLRNSLTMESQTGLSKRFSSGAKCLNSNDIGESQEGRCSSHLLAGDQSRFQVSGDSSNQETQGATVLSSQYNGYNFGHSISGREHLSNHILLPGARTQSQRIGRSLVSEKVAGSYWDGSNRSQSCRRESTGILNPLFRATLRDPSISYIQKDARNASFNSNSLRRLRMDEIAKAEHLVSRSPCRDPWIGGHLPAFAQMDPRQILDSPKGRWNRVDQMYPMDPTKMSCWDSGTLDQDIYSKLAINASRMADSSSQRSNSGSDSSCVSLAWSNASSPRTKARPSAAAAHLHKWLVNQLKLGSRYRCTGSSKLGDHEQHEAQSPRTKSPWRRLSEELFHGFGRKKRNAASSSWGSPALGIRSMEPPSSVIAGFDEPVDYPPLQYRMVSQPRMDAAFGNSTPRRRMMYVDDSPARRMIQADHYAAFNSSPSHRWTYLSEGGNSTPYRENMPTLLVDAAGNSASAHRISHLPSYRSSPVQWMMPSAVAGNSTPIHSAIHREACRSFASPAHSMMPQPPLDACLNSSSIPNRRIYSKSMTNNDDPGNSSRRLAQTATVDSRSTPSPGHRLMQMVGNSTPSYHKAYVLPPIPGSPPVISSNFALRGVLSDQSLQ